MYIALINEITPHDYYVKKFETSKGLILTVTERKIHKYMIAGYTFIDQHNRSWFITRQQFRSAILEKKMWLL
jgi:hypothetical protein